MAGESMRDRQATEEIKKQFRKQLPVEENKVERFMHYELSKGNVQHAIISQPKQGPPVISISVSSPIVQLSLGTELQANGVKPGEIKRGDKQEGVKDAVEAFLSKPEVAESNKELLDLIKKGAVVKLDFPTLEEAKA